MSISDDKCPGVAVVSTTGKAENTNHMPAADAGGGPAAADAFAALLPALTACSSDLGLLRSWVAQHGVNTDVVVPDGRGADNRGSPLLIAVECNMPEACAALLGMGADVNYKHPASHGNAPLLRCAEMGYDECLGVLLSDPAARVAELSTNEHKLVLGQNVPQYEAGGRSALLLATEAGQQESVSLLLRHSQGRDLLCCKDSFGRTVLEAAFERAATKEAGSQARQCADEICAALCEAADSDFEITRARLMPDRATAIQRERERNRQLRRRYLVKSHEQRVTEVNRGLEAVRAGYEPRRLHPDIFAPTFPAHALLLEGWGSAVREPVPGTFAFPLLSESHCAKIYAELLHYEATAQSQPELQLPLYTRHDGNLGQLEACGFEPILRAIEAAWRPLVKHYMPTKGECQVYHAFLTRNWVGRDENATFKIHCDKSDLTFNLCLHASEDFEGSSVGFYRDPDGEGSAGATPTECDRIYTHRHRVGHAIMHDGEQFHKTDAITRGTRSSLIVWARLVGTPCGECGSPMGASWLFCKECGKEVAGR